LGKPKRFFEEKLFRLPGLPACTYRGEATRSRDRDVNGWLKFGKKYAESYPGQGNFKERVVSGTGTI